MFISTKQAKERLVSSANLLREKLSSVPETPVEGGEALPQDPEEPLVAEDPELVEDFKVPALDKLDALIKGRVASKRERVEKTAGFLAVADILGNEMASGVLGTAPRKLDAKAALDRPEGDRLLIERRLRKVKSRVALKSSRKLSFVVDQITEEKIEAIESPLELARLGRDLATVTQSMSPKDEQADGGIHFHVYRPERKELSDYETVTVGVRVDP